MITHEAWKNGQIWLLQVPESSFLQTKTVCVG